jgi:hypothetical protein
MEIWKDIPGYETLYQASNLGRIKRILFKNNIVTKKENKILKTRINKNNREQIMLYKNGKRKNMTVHRLVASAFLENPNNYPEVNHIDGNSLNNNVNNLEWCTKQYNMKHAYDNNLTHVKEYNKKMSKPIIRNDGKKYDNSYSASKDLGVSVFSIRDVLKGRSKTCKGYSFKYL